MERLSFGGFGLERFSFGTLGLEGLSLGELWLGGFEVGGEEVEGVEFWRGVFRCTLTRCRWWVQWWAVRFV